MSEATFASLEPVLLARKGGAKPAMRPQLGLLPEHVGSAAGDFSEEALEDLGWNDMGADHDAQSGDHANVVSLNPANCDFEADSPVVRRQQRDLADRVLADAVMQGPDRDDTSDDDATKPVPEATTKAQVFKSKSKKPAKTKKVASRRAAFTLRLDSNRHRKLRVAAAMRGVSAQSLVTCALDAMLSEIEELDALIERMK